MPQIGREYIDSVKASHGRTDGNIRLAYAYEGGYEHYTIIPLRPYDPDYLTPSEMAVIDETVTRYGSTTARELSEISHDKAWNQAKMWEKVDITIDMKSKENLPIVEEQYENIVFLTQSAIYA